MGSVVMDTKTHDEQFDGLQDLIEVVACVDSDAAEEIRPYGERAIELEYNGQYDEAAEECLAMLEIVSDVFEVYRYVALELIVFGKEAEAIKISKRAIALDPLKPAGYELLGETSYTLNQYDKAIDAYQQATLLGTKNSEAYLLMGHSYLAVDQYKAAIEAYSKALFYKPEDWYARSYLGRAYYNSGSYKEAVSSIRKCLEIAEDGSGQVLQLLGDSLYSLGRPREAIAPYKKSLEIKPQCAGWQLKLARAYKASGQNEKANKVMQVYGQLLLEVEREEQELFKMVSF
jgi:tetratricopeptide (TPR) repeat protein